MALVLASLAAWLGLNAPMAATAIPVSSQVAHAHVYDGGHLSAAASGTTTERGPPTECGNSTTYDADGHSSHGAPVRPIAANYAYDSTGQLARSANAAMTIEEAAPTSRGASASQVRSSVAAKTADEARGAVVDGIPRIGTAVTT